MKYHCIYMKKMLENVYQLLNCILILFLSLYHAVTVVPYCTIQSLNFLCQFNLYWMKFNLINAFSLFFLVVGMPWESWPMGLVLKPWSTPYITWLTSSGLTIRTHVCPSVSSVDFKSRVRNGLSSSKLHSENQRKR